MATKQGINFGAMLAGKCPRCHQGAVFKPLFGRGALSMNRRCAECGLDFEPESGYYLGAIYVSYGIAVLTVLPFAVALIFVAGASLAVTMALTAMVTVLGMVLMFRISRIVWLHVDWALAPRLEG